MPQQQPISPKNASEKEKKLLKIRGDLQGLIMREDWSAVTGMIRGIRYADKELAVELVVWKNKWQQQEQTLLHDLLTMPQGDPPLPVLKLLIDTAPQVLFMEDESGNLPVNTAIFHKNRQETKKRSLDVIKFLVQSDLKKKNLSPITFWQAIRRDDENVTRYLLTFPQCAKALVIKVNGRVPLYYSAKSILEKEGIISPLLKLVMEATSDQLGRSSCCLYRSIENVAPFLAESDRERIFELARQDKVYCTNHLVDVARRKDTLVAKRQARQAVKVIKVVSEETGDEHEQSESNGVVVESHQSENGTTTSDKVETDENGESADTKGSNGVASPKSEEGVVWAESEDNYATASEEDADSSSD